MRIVTSIDPLATEAWLAEHLLERPSRAGGLPAPALVLVPTHVLLGHLQRRLLARTPALVGVWFHTWRSLARAALRAAFRPTPDLLAASTLEELFSETLSTLGHPLRRGARRACLATCVELRNAGITADELRRLQGSSAPSRELLVDAYEDWTRRLDLEFVEGASDAAGIVRAAIPEVDGLLRHLGVESAIAYGAWDLIGVHLELLRAIDAQVETSLVVPTGTEGTAFSFARTALERVQPARELWTCLPPSAERAGWCERVGVVGQSGQRADSVEASGAPTLERQHTQGREAELEAAALRALALLSESTAKGGEGAAGDADRSPLRPEEVAIVARNLRPWAETIEPVLERVGLPYTSTARPPLTRDREVRALLSLLRALETRLERRAVFSLLRQAMPKFLEGLVERGDIRRWDDTARRLRIFDGLESWSEVPARAQRADNRKRPARDASLRRLVFVCEQLEQRRARLEAARDSGTEAMLLASLAREGGYESEALESLLEAWRQQRETLARQAPRQNSQRVSRTASQSSVEQLTRLAEEGRIESSAHSPEGVRILGLQDARGLHHRVVLWIGFQGGTFPASSRADTWLSDTDCRTLSALTGKPLASSLSRPDEERLLLATTLAATGERLVLSWQRADEDGKKVSRSSLLREVARAFLGRAEARAIDSDAIDSERIPTHPTERAQHLATSPRFGLLPRSEALAATASAGPKAADGAIDALLPNLESVDRAELEACFRQSIREVRVIESKSGVSGPSDGRTGIPWMSAATLYPTHIEMLASCPQRFFLRRVLGARPLGEEPRRQELRSRVFGNAVHTALEDIYGLLAESGALYQEEEPRVDVDRALDLVASNLPAIWSRRLREQVGPAWKRQESLLELLTPPWLAGLRRYIEGDLMRLLELPVEALAFEEEVSARIETSPDRQVRLSGRIDRLTKGGGRVSIEDYKTGASVEKKAEVVEILRGSSLQLPLYRELVASQEGLEADNIDSRFVALRPGILAEHPLDTKVDWRQGFLETVDTVLRLLEVGNFPLGKKTIAPCRWCDWAPTCRKDHVPTLARRDSCPDLADFRDNWRKSKKAMSLAALRAKDDEAPPTGGDETEGGGRP